MEAPKLIDMSDVPEIDGHTPSEKAYRKGCHQAVAFVLKEIDSGRWKADKGLREFVAIMCDVLGEYRSQMWHRFVDHPALLDEAVTETRQIFHSHDERRKMTPSLRFKVLRRDGHRCVLCGATAQESRLEVDHIHPVSSDGKTEMENLQTLCWTCNRGKGRT